MTDWLDELERLAAQNVADDRATTLPSATVTRLLRIARAAQRMTSSRGSGEYIGAYDDLRTALQPTEGAEPAEGE